MYIHKTPEGDVSAGRQTAQAFGKLSSEVGVHFINKPINNFIVISVSPRKNLFKGTM